MRARRGAILVAGLTVAGALSPACSLIAPSESELAGGATPSGGSAGDAGRAPDPSGGGGATGGAGRGGAQSGGTAGGAGKGAGGSSGGGTNPTGGVSAGSGGTAGAGMAGGSGAAAAAGTGNGGSAGFSTVLPLSGLTLWLRADAGVSLAGAGVSEWLDQSGMGHRARQVSASARPTVLDDWRNGQPALSFDGDDDHLLVSPGFADFSEGMSLFVVLQALPSSVCTGVVEFSNGNEIDDISIHRDFETSVVFEIFETSLLCEGDFADDTPLYIGALQTAEGDMSLHVNGAACDVRSGAPLARTIERTTNWIGRSSYSVCGQRFEGSLAELIIYSRGLASAERLLVDEYLRTKYDL